MSVVAWSGRLPVFGGRLSFASRVGHEKSRLFTHWMVNATRGMDILLRMRSHQWMMRATLSSLVSGVAIIMIARTRGMSWAMRKGNE